MTHQPLLLIQHKVSLPIAGIVRYRIKVQPSQAKNIKSIQFRIRNSSPIYRNITPGSGPWKISVALVRNPDKTPAVPELVPLIGCAQVCRLDAKVNGGSDDQEEGSNEWELEVMSEMVLQANWIDVKVEVFAVLREGSPASELVDSPAIDAEVDSKPDIEVQPQVLQPSIVSCEYKDTVAICGPTFPEHAEEDEGATEDLHLVLLTHGIHGTWLDLLYMKEQIDAQNRHHGKTVTLLTDTNHAGTEEGIQMAGQRVALDILEFTGYTETEDGKKLYRSLSTVARKKSLSKAEQTKASGESSGSSSPVSVAPTRKNQSAKQVFPRGFSKVSIIGHSLGGLINIYALGFIEDVTKGAFFKTIQPVHFITLATPLLGIGFEHPWVLGFALQLGVIGQTGKDLALEGRPSKHKGDSKDKEITTAAHSSARNGKHTASPPECALDLDTEPLLLAMARPGSVSHQVLRQFRDRTSYANIENDMAVRFNTSSMMGIPTFDMDKFFSPEGAATQPRKNLYHSALTSTLALLFPGVPAKAKFLSIADAPSPVVVVSHVEPEAVVKKDDEQGHKEVEHNEMKKKKKRLSPPRDSRGVSRSSSVSSRGSSNTRVSTPRSSSSGSPVSKSRLDLAHLAAEGYHADMDWTKIGVYIEQEAHVQIIVRRKWYNLDGWKCVQDLVERFDFA
ncbi:putative serine esterase-domain-containing protein [Dissophora ornata]|nr:hypothetical protein BGZ58_007293 [Dissophora ornata]KAI8596550.1 putative serine esterase-domain-containing protein [Dissophora ornata]